MIQELGNITRISVVGPHEEPNGTIHDGLAFERWNVKVRVSVQDDGRTLKLFIEDRPESRRPRQRRRTS